MEPWEIIILVGTILLALIITACIIKYNIIHQRKAKIAEALQARFSADAITWHHDRDPYQIAVETESTLYLIKVVPFYLKSELIITNPTFWCVNQDPRNWKRSSKPELVPGVEAFLAHTPETKKKISRIALIYPGAYNISRYLNESDVELVSHKQAVHGVFFVRFVELQDFLANQG